jgi:hypothetical protein
MSADICLHGFLRRKSCYIFNALNEGFLRERSVSPVKGYWQSSLNDVIKLSSVKLLTAK